MSSLIFCTASVLRLQLVKANKPCFQDLFPAAQNSPSPEDGLSKARELLLQRWKRTHAELSCLSWGSHQSYRPFVWQASQPLATLAIANFRSALFGECYERKAPPILRFACDPISPPTFRHALSDCLEVQFSSAKKLNWPTWAAPTDQLNTWYFSFIRATLGIRLLQSNYLPHGIFALVF